MNLNPNQPSSGTILAAITALATLIGAIGGLIATVYAVGITDSGTAASTPTPTPAAVVTSVNTSAPTPAATAEATPSSPPTPAVVVVTAGADRWWGPPGTSSSDEEEGGEADPGQSEDLPLSWGCARDRGNGRGKDCGSGLIAVYFDMAGLPDGVSIDEAVLTLYSQDAADGMVVYSLPATSGWSEKESDPPSCDASDETLGDAAADEWRWDVTGFAQDQHAGDTENFGFCLVLSDDKSVTFGSREGAHSQAPSLTVTYTTSP
jgi:hypothetical protein